MVTVGLDFGTHQTKVCYERIENGTYFYDIFRFPSPHGKAEEWTLPSLIRLCADETLRYGHDAAADGTGGQSVAYFKQKMFSTEVTTGEREIATRWAVLYLAFVLFQLDARFHGPRYVVQMGMPTSADPGRYDFCKHQALQAMAAAMLIVRDEFQGDLNRFLRTSRARLVEMVEKCRKRIPHDIGELRRRFPILVFPEAYAALIPLINDRKLPKIGPSLFVDIGGGTVDISFFTNQMDKSTGKDRPCLYYYHSVPYGLNMITGQDINRDHNVRIGLGQITREAAVRFRENLMCAVDEMMAVLKKAYEQCGKTVLMPFSNLCAQMLDGRPICYSGGGSMFPDLKRPVERMRGIRYRFTDCKSVSELINHSKLYVRDSIFPVLATAFALSHQSLAHFGGEKDPDSIALVSIGQLFDGVKLPQQAMKDSHPIMW